MHGFCTTAMQRVILAPLHRQCGIAWSYLAEYQRYRNKSHINLDKIQQKCGKQSLHTCLLFTSASNPGVLSGTQRPKVYQC